MTREDIIRMARDSGMELYGLGKDREKFVHYLQEFAALVAAASEAKEREAMVEEASKKGWAMRNEDAFEDAVREIAAIRARGQA